MENNFRPGSMNPITLDKYVNGPIRFPKKTRGMPGPDLYLNSDRIRRRAKRIMYFLTAV